MPFREKVRRIVFGHPVNNPKTPPCALNSKGMKVEFYRRHEIPPSKFRGPFDRNFQKQLSAWNFKDASSERPRSPDLSLSPCTTLPLEDVKRSLRDDSRDSDEPSEEYVEDVPAAKPLNRPTHTARQQQPAPPSGQNNKAEKTDSTSSTAVDPESMNSSLATLYEDHPSEPRPRADSISRIKQSNRNTTSAPRPAPSHPVSSKEKQLPFAPEDLTRALNAVRL